MIRPANPWSRIWILALAAALLLGLAACSDDDDSPVTPIDETVRAVSPDSVAELLSLALAEGDSMRLYDLLSRDFRYAMTARTVAYFNLGTDYLNRDETMQAAGKLLAGRREAENVLDVVWDDLGSISVEAFVKVKDWEEADIDSTHSAVRSAIYAVKMYLPFEDGTNTLLCDFLLTLYAEEYAIDAEGEPVPHWKLVRAEDSFPDVVKFSTDELALTEVLCGHLKIGEPTGTLTASDAGGFPQPRFLRVVSNAADDVHGLSETPYWFPDPAGYFGAEWTADAVHEQDLAQPGEVTVRAFVRNRWNKSVELTQTLTVELGDPPPATTRDLLMTNFRDAYEGMYYDALTAQLHPDFKMVLMPQTIDFWNGTVGEYFDRTTFDSILDNLFGGQTGVDANGNTIHPIDSIFVSLLEQQVGWAPIPGDDPYFGTYDGSYAPFRITVSHYDPYYTHRFLVQQQVLFYVVPVDEGGETVYRLLGVRGLASARKTDEVTWDALLALYR